MFTYLYNTYLHIYMFTYSQYWKNNDIEKHFKKYTQYDLLLTSAWWRQ